MKPRFMTRLVACAVTALAAMTISTGPAHAENAPAKLLNAKVYLNFTTIQGSAPDSVITTPRFRSLIEDQLRALGVNPVYVNTRADHAFVLDFSMHHLYLVDSQTRVLSMLFAVRERGNSACDLHSTTWETGPNFPDNLHAAIRSGVRNFMQECVAKKYAPEVH